MTRIWTGTASVTNGDATVVLTGAALTDANCPADGMITLDGATYFILSRTNTTTLELTRNYTGTTSGSIPAEIDPMNANAISLITLSKAVADYNAKLALLDSRGHGLFYQSLGYTASGDPGPGKLARNNSTWSSVTELYIDPIDASDTGVDQTGIIEQWASGTLLIVQSIETGEYASFKMGLAPQNETGWFKLGSLTYVDGSGPADGEDIRVVFVLKGNGISSTPKGAWDSGTTYSALDLVEHGGYVFLSAEDNNLNHEPVTSPSPASDAHWTYIPLPGAGDFCDVAIYAEGLFTDGEVLQRVVFASSATFAAGLSDSQFSAGAAPAADAVITLKKNGSSIGTITFAASATTGTVSFASDVTFDAGDVLEVDGPATSDTTLSDVSITLRGTRSASGTVSQQGTATLDFGSFPGATDATVAVTGIPRIKSTSLVEAWLWPGSGTVDHTADEHKVVGMKVLASDVVAGTGFSIFGVTNDKSRLHGQWNVAWRWS